MPSLTFETLNEIISKSDCDLKNFKTFIETGTHYGGTIIPMSNHFETLYTIELSERIYNIFNSKNLNNEKIKSLLGDSSKLFPTFLPEINNDSIFFLDGHYSSGETAQGEKDVPLIEELSAINSYFNKTGIIIIDDLRLFGTNNFENWGEITKDNVLKPIKDRITKTFEHGDRFIIIIKDKII
jgi:hypothetical protein